jgi:hypothetical protein
MRGEAYGFYMSLYCGDLPDKECNLKLKSTDYARLRRRLKHVDYDNVSSYNPYSFQEYETKQKELSLSSFPRSPSLGKRNLRLLPTSPRSPTVNAW